MNIDLLREAFAKAEFSTREASTVLGTSGSTTRTLLNDLRTKGFLTKTSRGRYRVAEPSHNLELERRRTQLRLDEALEPPLLIGLDGPDALALWTRGRYTVSTESNAIHIAVAAVDEAAYRKYLEEVGLKVGQDHRKPHVVLRVLARPRFTSMAGKPVVDRDEILKIIRKNPIAYEGAEEWLVKT